MNLRLVRDGAGADLPDCVSVQAAVRACQVISTPRVRGQSRNYYS